MGKGKNPEEDKQGVGAKNYWAMLHVRGKFPGKKRGHLTSGG